MFYYVIVVILILILFYFYNIKTFKYWKRRGIQNETPVFLVGTYLKVYQMQQSRSQLAEHIYWKYPNEKVVGGFKSTTPELIIRDPDLIKCVLQLDFVSFHHRGNNPANIELEPLKNHLFGVDGDLWRMLRKIMTPAFTSGKLKAMFPLIVERAEILQSVAKDAAKSQKSVNAKELMARYTTDFIGSCGFGINSESLQDENSPFRNLGRKVFKTSIKLSVINMLKDMFPEWTSGLKLFGDIESQLISLVQQIIKERDYKPCGRNDFIDLLLEHRNKPMVTDSLDKINADGKPMIVETVLDDVLFAAQVFVFFAAGFETSASSSSFTLHQLAYHPEIQKKVQEDIDNVLKKFDNKLCYEAIKEMTYLECAFKESLRMFPSLGILIRRSTRKYTFNDINLSIDKGVNIIIPVQALHMDPKYWESPEKYMPERFQSENFGVKQKSVYFPFGEGPRNCIGSRLGLMQSMAGLAAILAKFSVEPAADTIRNPVVNPKSNIVQSFEGGLPLQFKLRNN